MSRTFKDRPNHIRFSDYSYAWHRTLRFLDGYDNPIWMQAPKGTHKKKKKKVNTEWEWLKSTPSWWTRLTMNKPQRRKCRLWEAKVKYMVDLEETDCPFFKNKPHNYYW